MFLDLRQDRYVSVPRTLMNELAPRICGWQLPSTAAENCRPLREESAQLEHDLLAAGILRPYAGESRPRHPKPTVATTDYVSIEDSAQESGIHCSRLCPLAALISADFTLRRTPLWRITARLATDFAPLAQPYRPDLTRTACALTARFRSIRPWYPRDYLCLFDSLALTQFLLSHAIRALWVFGVREDPFAAHCWVQYGNVILNEYLDRTLLYTPIMAV